MKYMMIQINDIPDNEFIIEELKRYLECKIDTTLKLLNDRHRLSYEMHLHRDPYSYEDMWCELYDDLEEDMEDFYCEGMWSEDDFIGLEDDIDYEDIFDYLDRETYIDVDLDDPKILAAFMRIVSGDEILSVVFEEDGIKHYERYDAYEGGRMFDYYDDDYLIVAKGEWQVDRDKFLNRKSATWRWYDLEDENDAKVN